MEHPTTRQVKTFYEELPFNKCEEPAARSGRIRSNAVRRHYPDLDTLLLCPDIKSVLEVGCGVGWLSNTLGYHYDVEVLGMDLAARAIDDARALCDALQLAKTVAFVEEDLFRFNADKQYDLVVSLGVLHHTFDARAAFAAIARLVRPGGFIYVGLYHSFGRQVFLALFRQMMTTKGEQFAFDYFIKTSGKLTDDKTFQKSWFRDQVCHVHESQHTLKEVAGWLEESGFCIHSTSINRFQKIVFLPDLFEMEKEMTALSYQKNCIEQTYFPGFFTVAAVKAL